MMVNMQPKIRYFAFLGYPESMPENWQQLLELSGLKALAILHDRDLSDDPEEKANGVLKKAHYHFLIDYRAPTTRRKATQIAEEYGTHHIEVLISPGSYARYMTHQGEKYQDKFQYDPREVLEFGGASYEELSCSNEELKSRDGLEILDMIVQNDITGLDQLLELARHRSPTLVSFIIGHAYFCQEIIYSHNRYKQKRVDN